MSMPGEKLMPSEFEQNEKELKSAKKAKKNERKTRKAAEILLSSKDTSRPNEIA